MGREVRMVPPGWKHPKDDRGRFIPMFVGGGYAAVAADWDEGYAKWQEGCVRSYGEPEWEPRTESDGATYTEYSGRRPSPDDYMPEWTPEQATMLMMYEDTSEGTPISPAFSTPEELAHWLADNNASAFGGMGASYESWLAIALGGWAPSMVMTSTHGIESGVQAMSHLPTDSEE